MTEPDPSLREVALAAARTSDAGAELLASLEVLGHSVRAARTAGFSIEGVGRELRRGRASARLRRARALIRPSVRLAEHSDEVIAAATACGLTDIRVFGSCVRGTDTRLSDVDLLVDGGPRTSLLTISAFVIAVADLLGLEEERVDVVTPGGLVPGSHLERQIAAECQPLAAWAAGWPRLDSLPGWRRARAAGASEEELVEAGECGLHRWGWTATALRSRPEGRPAGATLVDPEEFVRVAAVLDRYAAARSGAGLDHDAAITRAVTTPRPV